MKKIIEHALIVLEKQGDWMTRDELTTEVRQVFPKAYMNPVFKYLYGQAHIGYEHGAFRYYEPNDLTNHVQACLNRGDNW